MYGFEGLCCEQAWASYDECKMVELGKTIAVQINGKFRGTVCVPADSEDDVVKEAALNDEKIKKFVEGKDISKTIIVQNNLINLIIKA